MEVGEYIRDIDRGEILQVENVWKDDDRLGIKFKEYAGSNTFSKDDLKRFKHSKNIIDLIEVGDYVNGFKIYNMEYITYNNRVDLVFTIFKTPIDFTSPYKVIVTWQEKDIKSILTHEMYEQNCYKIGE